MAGSPVRELIASVKFQLDRSSVSAAERAISKLKRDLDGLSRGNKKISIGVNMASVNQALSRIRSQLSNVNLRMNANVTGMTIRAQVVNLHGRINGGGGGGNGGGGRGSRLSTFSDHGSSVAATGMAMVGSIAYPVKQAMDFESAMADVRKVVDFETPEQFKQMGDDITELSTKIPMTREQIAQIVAAGGQSGIERENLMAFAEAASKMGIAFDISAEEAGNSMAKWRTGMKLTQKEVVELADQVNYLSNNTAASASDISRTITRVGALAKTAGLADGEIAALAASMIGAGAMPEVAATGIQNLMLNLQAGENATRSQAEAFEELGLDAVETAKNLKTNAVATILDVFRRINSLEGYRQTSVMENLFGRESIDAIAPMLGNLGNVENNFGMVADPSLYIGSMQKEADTRSGTTANQLNLTMNEIKATAGEIGASLLPVLKELLVIIKDATSGFLEFAKANPKLVAGLTMFVGILGTFLTLLGGAGVIISGLLSVSEVLLSIWGLIGPTVTAVGAAIASLGAPVIAVIVAIIAAIIGLIVYWDELKAFAIEAVTAIMEWCINAADTIASAFGEKINAVKGFFTDLKTHALQVVDEIVTAISEWLGGKIEWAKGALSDLKSFASSAVDYVLGNEGSSSTTNYNQTNYVSGYTAGDASSYVASSMIFDR